MGGKITCEKNPDFWLVLKTWGVAKGFPWLKWRVSLVCQLRTDPSSYKFLKRLTQRKPFLKTLNFKNIYIYTVYIVTYTVYIYIYIETRRMFVTHAAMFFGYLCFWDIVMSTYLLIYLNQICPAIHNLLWRMLPYVTNSKLHMAQYLRRLFARQNVGSLAAETAPFCRVGCMFAVLPQLVVVQTGKNPPGMYKIR